MYTHIHIHPHMHTSIHTNICTHKHTWRDADRRCSLLLRFSIFSFSTLHSVRDALSSSLSDRILSSSFVFVSSNLFFASSRSFPRRDSYCVKGQCQKRPTRTRRGQSQTLEPSGAHAHRSRFFSKLCMCPPITTLQRCKKGGKKSPS